MKFQYKKRMQPTKLTIPKDKKSMRIAFGDGQDYEFTAEILRVLSPSAEVQGHSPDQKKLISGKKNVEIMQVEPVGNYAVRIVFDDMHDTGIYSWKFFLELGETQDEKWANYLKQLEEKGYGRDPVFLGGAP